MARTTILPLILRLSLLAVLGLLAFTTQAQVAPPTWASVQRSDATRPSGARGDKVAVAADGSQFVSGLFVGTVTFGSTTISIPSSEVGLWLAKYNPNGTVAWVRHATQAAGDTRAAVAVDGAGNAYLTGYFSGTLTFVGSGVAPFTAGAGVTDSYLAKFDLQGNLLWARTAGTTAGNSYAAGVGTDASGNVYVAGDFSGALNFGGVSVSASDENVFLYKFTPAGTAVWARTAGGLGIDYASSLATDPAGNAYLTGSVRQTATFGNITLPGTGAATDEDAFVVKYDPQGTAQWAQRIATTNRDAGVSVAVDAAGNVAVGGYANNVSTATTDNSNILVARYTSQGALAWTRQFTPTVPDFYAGYGVAFDNRGGLYMTGGYNGTLTFGTTTLANAEHNLYVVRFDGQGNTTWADKVASQAGGNGVIGLDVATDAAGNAYLTGAVQGDATFGTFATTGTGGNVFLAKLAAGGIITAARPAAAAAPLRVYPNPASAQATLVLPAGGGRLALTDALGRTVREQALPAAAGPCPVSLIGLQPGLYQLRATLGNGQVASARLTVR